MRSVLKDDILADEKGEKVYPGWRRRTCEKGPMVRAPLNPGGGNGKSVEQVASAAYDQKSGSQRIKLCSWHFFNTVYL